MTTEYARFQVSASAIASLLGQFGYIAQFKAICDIIGKSERKELLNLNQFKSIYAAQREYLSKCNILKTWETMKIGATKCTLQDHIKQLAQESIVVLFSNEYIVKEIHNYGLFKNCLINPIICEADQNTLIKLQSYKRPEWALLLQHFEIALSLYRSIMKIGRTSYGKTGESIYINQFNRHCAVLSKQIHSCHAPAYRPTSDCRFSWGINGRIDGMIGDTIIEIKHRTDKFNEVPVHDLIQIHAYMYMLNKPNADLIECIRTASDGLITNITNIPFNQSFWTNIMHKLSQVLDFIDNLVEKDITWDSFCQCSDTVRAALLEKYIGNISI